jgi:superoxide reductase
VCGIVVEICEGGAGEPVCCGRPMTLQSERTAEDGGPHAAMHRLEGLRAERRLRVSVGGGEHPMDVRHAIQWVELLAGGRVDRRALAPGDSPECEFELSGPELQQTLTVRAFCNKHGLWKGTLR